MDNKGNAKNEGMTSTQKVVAAAATLSVGGIIGGNAGYNVGEINSEKK